VTLWFCSCVEFEWQYMLNFYTLIVDVESAGVKAEQKNAKLST